MGNWAAIARRVRVPLGFAFAIVYFWLAKPNARSIVVGVGLAIPGILLRALASGHVNKNEELTTTGPYAYTRNPLYLGSLIIAAGFVVAALSWWIAGVAVVFFVVVYVPVIGSEEDYLRQTFPAFDQYAKEVPRLLPRLRASGVRGSFSWDLYWKHREYNAVLGLLGMTAALVAKMIWLIRP